MEKNSFPSCWYEHQDGIIVDAHELHCHPWQQVQLESLDVCITKLVSAVLQS